MRFALVLFIFLFAVSGVVFCDTYLVPRDFESIQAAIDAVLDWDVIQVAPGHYSENINFHGKRVTVESVSGPADTILDGGNSYSVVLFENGEGPDSMIKGFTIRNGWISGGGGGIRCISGSSPVVMDNIITGNRSHFGAGIFCNDLSSPTIIGNKISNNRAESYGGGIFCYSSSSPEITDNTISANNGHRGGGICCEKQSSPPIKSNTISANYADEGGGIYCTSGSTPSITGNTINGNWTYAGGKGGGVYGYLSFLAVEGNIIIGNMSTQGGGVYGKSNTLRILNNTIDGNTADNGAGIFCEEGKVLRAVGNHIAGNLSTSSLTGCAIFCKEMESFIMQENTIEENDSGVHCKSTTGRVVGNHFLGNRGHALQVNSGGQFIINGNTVSGNTGRGFVCQGLESLSLEGNTINGNMDIAIHCNSCSPVTIIGNTVSGNETQAGCAGIDCQMSNVDIRQNDILNNHSTSGSGGIYLWTVSGNVEKNIIQGNSGTKGGGVQIRYCGGLTLADNIVSGNNALDVGGGIFCKGLTSPVLTNNIISNNKAQLGGGLGIKVSAHPDLTNNTITGNEALDAGGGLYIETTTIGMSFVYNTIMYGNTAPAGPAMALGAAGKLTISHSDVEGGLGAVHQDPDADLTWGVGMIDADPLFVDVPGGDFHLTYLSPCRGTGDNTAQDLPDKDFEGDPRVAQVNADMGADEFHTHLYCTGDATPGGDVVAKFVGWPGSTPVALWFGSALLDPPLPSVYGYWYLEPPNVFAGPLGVIPPDGVMKIGATVQPTPPPPYDLFMQAFIKNELTNPYVLEVR